MSYICNEVYYSFIFLQNIVLSNIGTGANQYVAYVRPSRLSHSRGFKFSWIRSLWLFSFWGSHLRARYSQMYSNFVIWSRVFSVG